MKRIKVQKDGWNAKAALAGPFWYIARGMLYKGLLLLAITLCTFGLGIIPVWVYCGHNANKEFYTFLKNRNQFIY